MNTNELKTFGKKARTILVQGVARKLHFWGFAAKGPLDNAEPEPIPGGYLFRGNAFDDPSVPALWKKLKEAVAKNGFDAVVEKAAYTWFNRLLATQILSKNGYELPLLQADSEEDPSPLLLKRARQSVYSYLNPAEKKRFQAVATQYEKETEAFGILLIGFCHGHPLLSRVFGTVDDFTELLLPDDILSPDGFLHLLNHGGYIQDSDYTQVELIGWLYQFYISEKKDQVFKQFKENKKAEKEDIPAATQIFTPNWIVKYMVENTVGRSWLDLHPTSSLKQEMKYLVEAEGNAAAEPIAKEAKDISLLDPASGSGHILVEGFDLLYKMYLDEYYSPKEAVEHILEHNLFGLDIDLRAAQMARFALLLKAARYYPDVLDGQQMPHIYAMPEAMHFGSDELLHFLGREEARGSLGLRQLENALRLMQESQNLGSVMQLELEAETRQKLESTWKHWQNRHDLNIAETALLYKLNSYLPVLLLLTRKYACIAANPPYMGQKNMNAVLKNYVNQHYPDTKSDLFAVFMEVCQRISEPKGRYGMINQHSWMFLNTFETYRKKLLNNYSIENMIHLGPRTFVELSGEVVQSTAFIIKTQEPIKNSKATYFRLNSYSTSSEKESAFLARENSYLNFLQNDFSRIIGSPIAYWASENLVSIFENSPALKKSYVSGGRCKTHGDETYLRRIWECSKENMGTKWKLYYKGGTYRRWYGNIEHVVNWSEDARKFYSDHGGLSNEKFWAKTGITWSGISTGKSSYRFKILEAEYASASPTIILEDYYKCTCLLGFMNSAVSDAFMQVINPTMQINVGDALKMPGQFQESKIIEKFVDLSISISRKDWDSRETSWDFEANPLIRQNKAGLAANFEAWHRAASEAFFQLHQNEEELNRIFIEIYGLQEELTPEVALKDITILQEELDYKALEEMQPPFAPGSLVPVKKDIPVKQLISYAIGCFMGRYRLDKPGLHIAHPQPSAEELAPYNFQGKQNLEGFEIDEDAILPLMGSRCAFPDDALQRLRGFLEMIWGAEELTASLNFINQSLDKDLEDWLCKDFWPYHTRMYQKKPIYWLFASPKGAFQVLVYMHRMNAYTVEKIRDKYLLRHMQYQQQQIAGMKERESSLDKAGQKKLEQLQKDLMECEAYDLKLKDMATRQINFDLDDGVTKNFALFEGVVAAIK